MMTNDVAGNFREDTKVMKRSVLSVVLLVAVVVPLIGSAGAERAQSAQPAQNAHLQIFRLKPGEIVPGGPLRPGFKTVNWLSKRARAAVTALVRRNTSATIKTIPLWSGGSAGPVQPFIMAGKSPTIGGTTRITVQIVPLTFVFVDHQDSSGNPITLGVNPNTVSEVIASPNFAKAPYGTGNTQLGDAIQRAEFFPVEKPNWHTLLMSPKVLPPVTILLHDTDAVILGQTSDRAWLAEISDNFIHSQVYTILQLDSLKRTGFVILLSQNVITNAAIGFHGAQDFNFLASGKPSIQTFTWASWLDHNVAQAFSGTLYGVDVMPLSHEISEWMNDPLPADDSAYPAEQNYWNLIQPPWMTAIGGCQSNLEVGDAVAYAYIAGYIGFSPLTYEITLNGFTYHPQNEALFQWFDQENPSSAIDGAYSYPDETALTSASVSCP